MPRSSIQIDVTTSVAVDGVEFAPTEVTVTQSTGREANSAELKGFVADPAALRRNAEVAVDVGESTLFRGKLRTAKLEPEKIVRIEAYGIRHELHNAQFNLHFEGAQSFRSIIDSVFAKTAFSTRYDIGPSVRENQEIGEINMTDTSAMQGLQSLANRINAQLYVDTTNTLLFRSAWPGDTYRASHPIEMSAGEDDSEEGIVIIEGQGSGSLNPAAASVNSRVGASARAGAEGDDKKEIRLKERNITTDREAENVANKLAVELNSRKQSGTITHVGTPRANVFDMIHVPELSLKSGAKIATGTYQVDKVEHSITSSDGYTTKFTVRKPYGDTIDGLDQVYDPVQASYSTFSASLEDADPLIPSYVDTDL